MFTKGYGGERMTKRAHVTCNDPNRRQFDLTVTGTVEKFATIDPSSARLFGRKGEPIHTTIRIIPEEKYPFRILGPAQQEMEEFRYTLSSLDTPGSDGYLLTVENKRDKKGQYRKSIVLKTDSPVRPEIRIAVYGYVTE